MNLSPLRRASIAAILLAFAAPMARGDYSVLVGSLDDSSIIRYDADGAKPTTFVPPGGGGLAVPFGMGFGPDGNLYVASAGSGGVKRYAATGLPDPAPGQAGATFVPDHSGGLTFDADVTPGPDHNLYVSNALLGIYRFSGATGDPLPGPGAPAGSALFTNAGGLGDPAAAVFGKDGSLYVADFATSRVLRYDGAGNYLGDFVTAGSGGLSRPNDLVFGPDGNLYVTSLDTHDVLRYDGSTGAPLPAPGQAAGTAIFSSGHALDVPLGLQFGPDGNLYVADSSDITPEVVRYDGTTGAFQEVFVTPGEGGLTRPTFIAFAVPEPGSLSLLALGLLGLAARRSRERSPAT